MRFNGVRRALLSAGGKPPALVSPPITGPGVPWTPDQLGSALAAWWDASRGVTLNGSTVTAWADVVAGLSTTQSSVPYQPTFSATARNGKPGLVFTGSQILNGLASALPASNTAHTILVGGYKGDGTFRAAFGWGTYSNLQARVVGSSSASGQGGQATFFCFYNDMPTPNVWNGVDMCFVHTTPGSTSPVDNIYIDGTQAATKGQSTYNTPASPAVGIGGLGSANKWVGTIQQIVVLNRVATEGERQKLEGWESWVNGKAGANLSADHPFKARAPLTSD